MTETTNTLVTLDDVRRNAEVAVLVRKADHNLEVLGYTEHSERHATIVATTARNILLDLGRPERTAELAAGNHEEQYGEAISDIAAALILGDKSDVNRDRVRNPDPHTFDIHDRVNLASQNAAVTVDPGARTITLSLDIDTTVSQVMEYFEIFLSRMLMCRRAAAFLGCAFSLVINGTRLL
jgi:hypothetical protein